MVYEPKHFVLTDPREYDGSPYEVADRSIGQLAGITELAQKLTEATEIMARNAELERQCQAGDELDAMGWPNTAAGRRWGAVKGSLETAVRDLRVLQRVASFDPKNPPRES